MKILLLGAGGFIGSNLAEHLVTTSDHEVIGVDSDAEKLADIDRTTGRFEFIQGDVCEIHATVDELVASSDVVVDLIAYANPSAYVRRPLDVVDLNFFQNMRLVETCIKFKKRLIQFSTSEVYGRSEGRRHPFNEDDSTLIMGPIKNQRWIYASSKELLERIIYAHGQEGDLDFTIVRPFNFVGPKIDYLVEAGALGGPRVFSHFLSALLSGGPMRLVDGGNAHRTYTHISDASRAIKLIIERPDNCHNQIFNIGNPHNGATVRELAHLMIGLYGELTGRSAKANIEDISGSDFYGAGYEDCDWRVPDIAKISALGWTPVVDLRETFRSTMAWYLDRLSSNGPLPSFLQIEQPAALERGS
jgi:UDP-apiose/xylose synthase